MSEQVDIDAIVKSLSHPQRRQILAWLKEPERWFSDQPTSLDNGVCAGVIDRKTGSSQSTTSAHLANLQRANLVTTQRIGQWIYYRRNEAVIDAFVHYISRSL